MPYKDKYDLIIVGGGVLGTFSAYHALRLGKSVALIERNKTPQEATVRNFGQIVPSGLNTHWKQFGLKSLEIYKTLQSFADFSVRPYGSYYLASDNDEVTLLHELLQTDKIIDYESKILSAREACERLPGLKSQYCAGALHYPEEVSVDPRKMISLVIDYLIEVYQLTYLPYTIAQHFELNATGDCQITTNTKLTLTAEQLLICNGAEFQLLFPEYYLNEETECVKIHMMLTKPQPSLRFYGNILTGLSIRRYEAFRECPSYSLITKKNDPDPRIQQWGIHILFKQTDNGQVIIGDSHHYTDVHDKEDLGFDIRHDVNEYILDLAKEIFDLETFQIDTTWTGIYSQTKKVDIISKSFDGKIHILNAIGGKGMTAGPGYTYYHTRKLFEHD